MIGKPPKRKRTVGAGMSGSTSRMSRAEEKVLAAGLEGKVDISNRPKYISALNAEHARTGEKKSSFNQRTAASPKVATLDTATGKRTSQKKKLTEAQKTKAKKTAYNIRQAHKRSRKLQRGK